MKQKKETIIEESIISLDEARKKMGCSRTTIDKYWRNGFRGKKLATFRRLGRRFTSLEAVERFQEATIEEREGE